MHKEYCKWPSGKVFVLVRRKDLMLRMENYAVLLFNSLEEAQQHLRDSEDVVAATLRLSGLPCAGSARARRAEEKERGVDACKQPE